MAPSRIVKTIRLTDTRIDAIIEKLDACASNVNSDLRSAERFTYNVKGCVVHMQMPGTCSTTPYLVPTRNISATGLSFLHGCFVYPGTRCVVQLISQHGSWENVEAIVVRCSYAEDMIHEVALQFQTQIDPSLYCAQAVKARILLAEDDPSIARLAIMMLEKLNVEVDHVEKAALAVELAKQAAYDAILINIETPEAGGIEAVKKLRGQGYARTIVAAKAMNRSDDQNACIDAGCNLCVSRPYTRKTLEHLIEVVRPEPVVSSLAGDPTMVPTIDAFAAALPPRIQEIEAALASSALKELEILCRSLKAGAGGCGFEPISKIAEKIEFLVVEQADTDKLAPMVADLANLCRHVRGSTGGGGGA